MENPYFPYILRKPPQIVKLLKNLFSGTKYVNTQALTISVKALTSNVAYLIKHLLKNTSYCSRFHRLVNFNLMQKSNLRSHKDILVKKNSCNVRQFHIMQIYTCMCACTFEFQLKTQNNVYENIHYHIIHMPHFVILLVAELNFDTKGLPFFTKSITYAAQLPI